MYVLNVVRITKTNHQSIAQTIFAEIALIKNHMETSIAFAEILLLRAVNPAHTYVQSVGIV